MGMLITHVLDTEQGRPEPASGWACSPPANAAWPPPRTNDDGRYAAPLLQGDAFRTGQWELGFHVGEYFAGAGLALPDRRSWTRSRWRPAWPPTPITTCRCWYRRGATPPTAAVDRAAPDGRRR